MHTTTISVVHRPNFGYGISGQEGALVDDLTLAIYHNKTFFLCIVGENSPILLKRSFYTTYTIGENSFKALV